MKNETWLEMACRIISDYAKLNKTFAIEDVRATSGLVARDERLWGQATRRAMRNGFISKAGFCPTKASNGSPKVLWKSNYL